MGDLAARGPWIREPTGDTSVVFVHGILSNAEDAWKHANGTYWPDLLTKEEGFEGIGVYAISYRTGKFSGNYSLSDAVDFLKERLQLDGVMNSRRIIFVCHSMGGIVVRKFLVDQQVFLMERRIEFGLFLVASPSLGSRYANLLKPFAKAIGNLQAAQLQFSQSNVWLDDLDKNFMKLKAHGTLPLEGKELIEDVFIKFKKWWRLQVVEPISSKRYFGDPFKVPASDHLTIAKPESRNAIQHRLLCEFIKESRVGSGFRQLPVHLRIGLSSESPGTIADMLKVCQSMVNVLLSEKEKKNPLELTIDQFEYEQAYHAFDQRMDRYDVIMLDDLWLPRFSPRLVDLSSLEPFQRYFEERPFEDVFIPSLASVCRDYSDPTRVCSVPVSGNVQLLVYRKDLIAKAFGSDAGDSWLTDPDELLEFLSREEAQAVVKKPFLVRYATDNDVVDNFWELLRAYGYEERFGPNGEICVPERMARSALKWLQVAHPTGREDQCGWRDVFSLLDGQKTEAMMMFGWPVWIIPSLVKNREQQKLIGLRQFLKHPMMGFWSFAIPKSSRYVNEAMKIILALTTVPELQLRMSEAGLVPVLSDFPGGDLKEHPFWKENFDRIRDALRDARPRPRSPQWRAIEIELAKQVRRGEFESLPGLFQLTRDDDPGSA